MNAGRPSSLESIPTLTEVVSWPEPAGDAAPDSAAAVAPSAAASGGPDRAEQPDGPAAADQASAPAAAPVPLDEKQFSQRLLAEVQRQVELMLEVRLRESPVLSRAADAMVREARKELTSAMREVVSRAIAEESARRRS